MDKSAKYYDLYTEVRENINDEMTRHLKTLMNRLEEPILSKNYTMFVDVLYEELVVMCRSASDRQFQLLLACIDHLGLEKKKVRSVEGKTEISRVKN